MKWLKRLLFVVVCLVTLYGLFVAVENWRGKHGWDTYQREREAKGDSFDWKSITPPPVLDAENFAMTPLLAELFPKPPQHPRLDALRLPDAQGAAGNRYLGRVEDLAVWKKCFTNDDLLAALKIYEPMMKEISEALQQRPKCRFPVRYEDHVNALLPHLSPLRNVSRVYRLRALAELSAGQTDAAFEDVRLNLRLADTLKDEPTLISYLVNSSMLEMSVQCVWEGLAAHHWNDRQLASLQVDFANADRLAVFAHAMRGERLFGYSACRWLISKPKERLSAMESAGVQRNGLQQTLWLVIRLVPTGWWYQNLLTLDRFHTETYWPPIDLEHRRINSQRVRQNDNKLATMSRSPFNFLLGLLAPAVNQIFKKAGQAQTIADEAAVACALERYRLAKGEYPENLAALVPEFLAKIPTDVIDGKPLRYRRDAADKFTLWSVGWNEIDDGGKVELDNSKPPRPDFDKGDWVWQSWATP